MEALFGHQISPDTPASGRTLNELVRLIRKLRWMGMDGEAARIEDTLSQTTHADSVVADPTDTD